MRMILVLWLVALCPLAAKQRLDRIPLYFEQKGPGSFVVNSGGSTLTLDRQGIHLSSIHMSIAHASRHATIEGEQLLAAPVTRFNGKQMSRSQVFERVRYRSIRPGVDLIFHGANGSLEYDFIIAPGANPEDLRFQLDPSSIASIDESGELNIVHGAPTAFPGTLAWKRPVVYERESGKPVTGRFLLDRNEIGFAIGPYDRTQTLIIDPVLNYVTYLGSTGNEIGRVAADDQGNFYLAGSSTSQDLPVTAASFQPAFAGRTGNLITGDVFVAKFSAAGALTWLTYVGGKGDEYASGVAVDAQGNVLVTGFTNSRDFPLKNAAQSSYGGQGTNSFVPFGDAFLSKLSPDGSQLIYSTYLGGRGDDCSNAIVVDGRGNAYIAGFTTSRDFPTTAGVLQPSFKGSAGQNVFPKLGTPWITAGDGFVAKYDSNGKVVWATYFGGTSDDSINALALDANQNIYLGGMTLSYDFPVSVNAPKKTFSGTEFQNEFGNFGDAWVAKIDPTAANLIYSTYLGGRGDEAVAAIAVDVAGQLHVTGSTTSVDFPVTSNAYQRAYRGPSALSFFADFLFGDAFYTKVAADGGSFLYSTLLGGTGDDIGTGIAVDSAGTVYVGGITASLDFPVTPDAILNKYQGGAYDGFLVLFDAAGKQSSATYLGGSGNDLILSMALDKSGTLYFAGATGSPNLPTTTASAQRKFGGLARDTKFKGDAFVMRVASGNSGPVNATTGISAIANAASMVTGLVAPGMFFTATGMGLGSTGGTTLSPTGVLGTISGTTRILFGSTPAPLLSVSATSVTGFVPLNVQGKGTVQVVAEVNGKQLLPVVTVTVADAAPGVFTANPSGQGQALALNDSGTLNGDDNPVSSGSTITFYITGGGLTTMPRADGQLISSSLAGLAQPPTVTIGGNDATVARASTLPFETDGLIEVVVVIPDGIPSGPTSLYVSVGGAQSQDGVTVVVR